MVAAELASMHASKLNIFAGFCLSLRVSCYGVINIEAEQAGILKPSESCLKTLVIGKCPYYFMDFLCALCASAVPFTIRILQSKIHNVYPPSPDVVNLGIFSFPSVS
jgi:hypothetical protein